MLKGQGILDNHLRAVLGQLLALRIGEGGLVADLPPDVRVGQRVTALVRHGQPAKCSELGHNLARLPSGLHARFNIETTGSFVSPSFGAMR